MNAIAIASQLFVLVFAVTALILCIILFRHHRQFGWLLVAAVYIEPLQIIVIRACRGRPLLRHATFGLGPDGAIQVTQHIDFPVFYILSVLGLLLLVRSVKRARSNTQIADEIHAKIQ